MNEQQHKDPLHGVTLEMMLNQLVEHHGWEKMGQIIDIRCFNNDPSIKSSLQFLRKTPWARTKVEEMYLKFKRNVLKDPKHKKGGEPMKMTIILGIILSVSLAALTATAQHTAPTATPAPAEASKASAPAPATSITISRMEIAANVMDRKPVDVGTSFPAGTEKVYCYLEFKDVKKEAAVNIVWTLGQKEMGKSQLTIKPYPKFRSWANKSLYGMKGDWKVEVLDEQGNVLKSATFTVQ